MPNTLQNLAAGIAAIALVAVTWVPVVTVPPVQAATLTIAPYIA